SALQRNTELIRGLLPPQTRLMAMVKSNGYGHGLELAAHGALNGGASWLGVYHAGEALRLRKAGFQQPILVVGVTPADSVPALVEAGVDVTVTEPAQLKQVAAAANGGARPRVHLKIDTGLNRLGVRPEAVEMLARAAAAVRGRVEFAGIFTHFADADGADLAFTSEQHSRFLAAAELLHEEAAEALLHCAGTAATLRAPETHHDLVRVGIALYGYAPANTPDPGLRIAMHVHARVVQVRTVAAGETVGYGRTWRAPAPRAVATVALGYGQGLPRYLSNRGSLVIRGTRCPVVGIVSMDQVGVDVSEVADITAGDAALFIGETGGVRAGADEVAALGGTIAHEVLCGIAESVPRTPAGDPAVPAAVP
ncbi:MAG TPA: alanine racemase, partial [Candidatus Dormibacteraeota bacterium]|nr:alanine racemase [Candidatus Dormibacteraeota bacterium]